MRRGHQAVVSSALLFLVAVAVPYPCSAETPSCAVNSWSHRVLITELYPAALCQDEYVVLENGADEPLELSGWSLTDLEGTIYFGPSAVMAPHSSLTLSENASSFSSAYGRAPDIVLDDQVNLTLFHVSGVFRLGNDGDSVAIVDPSGDVVDVVLFGECADQLGGWVSAPLPAPRMGEVFRRLCASGVAVDTNTSYDWMSFRENRYGYTQHSPFVQELDPGALTAFVSPDCATEVVIDSISKASDSIRLCAYELDSSLVARSLLAASARGVAVRVFVDGTPTGGMSEDQICVLSALSRAGVTVRVTSGSIAEGIVSQFDVLHAKYMIVDSARLLVLSENFVKGSMTTQGAFGNRGWGVAIDDRQAAEYMIKIFDDDTRSTRRDVSDWTEDPRFDPGAVLDQNMNAPLMPGQLRPFKTSLPSSLELFVSPDASLTEAFLMNQIRGSKSVLAEQLQADALWGSRWQNDYVDNPLVQELVRTSSLGGEVRFLLDGSWFNLERNGAVVERFYSLMTATASGEAKLMCEQSPITVLHNKGLVLDGERSVVSSNNWVYASFARNRELAAVVSSPEIASYFKLAFSLDWWPDTTPPSADPGTGFTMPWGHEVVLDASSSTDDRLLLEYLWDFDSDGITDAHGQYVLYRPPTAGVHHITLTVVDAWGNRASSSLEVLVVGIESNDEGVMTSLNERLWSLPVLVALAVLCIRSARSVARKVNQRIRKSG